MGGYQKKVIFLKNTGSSYFEEAYFILNPNENSEKISHASMVKEANRIIEENFGRKKRIRNFFNFKTVFAFIFGSLFSIVICFVLMH